MTVPAKPNGVGRSARTANYHSLSPSSSFSSSSFTNLLLVVALLLVNVFLIGYILRNERSSSSNILVSRPTQHKQLDATIPLVSIPSSIPPSAATAFDCQSVTDAFLSNLPFTSSQFNHLRRQSYLHNTTCFELHYPQFRNAFLKRRQSTQGKHFHLHIPKSGGTSLCQTIKANNVTTPTHTCQYMPVGGPYWCCDDMSKRVPMTCEVMNKRFQAQFIVNENYLDFPLCLDTRLHSIMMREPVSRTLSNVEHYMDMMVHRAVVGSRTKLGMNRSTIVNGKRWFGSQRYAADDARRLNLIQSNYVTWSLVAGRRGDAANNRKLKTGGRSSPFDYVPGSNANDLTDAMETLSQFDFLMGIDANLPDIPDSCNSIILTMMGMHNPTLGHERKREVGASDSGSSSRGNGNVPGYQRYYRRETYVALNQYDLALYRHAVELIRADCDFFARIAKDARNEGGGKDSLRTFYLYD